MHRELSPELAAVRRWIKALPPAGTADSTKASEAAVALTQHDVIPILLRACTTRNRITCCTPSPSLTICSARDWHTALSAAENLL